MSAPEPTAEHVDAVARGLRAAGVEVGYVGGDRFRQEVARRLLTSTDPAVHAALAASLPDEVMLAALVERGTLTEETRSAEGRKPGERRYFTPWEVAP